MDSWKYMYRHTFNFSPWMLTIGFLWCLREFCNDFWYSLKLIRMKENPKIMAPSVLLILYYYPSITDVKPSTKGHNIVGQQLRTTPNNVGPALLGFVASFCM